MRMLHPKAPVGSGEKVPVGCPSEVTASPAPLAGSGCSEPSTVPQAVGTEESREGKPLHKSLRHCSGLSSLWWSAGGEGCPLRDGKRGICSQILLSALVGTKTQRSLLPQPSFCCPRTVFAAQGQVAAISTGADVTPQGGFCPSWDAAAAPPPTPEGEC